MTKVEVSIAQDRKSITQTGATPPDKNLADALVLPDISLDDLRICENLLGRT